MEVPPHAVVRTEALGPSPPWLEPLGSEPSSLNVLDVTSLPVSSSPLLGTWKITLPSPLQWGRATWLLVKRLLVGMTCHFLAEAWKSRFEASMCSCHLPQQTLKPCVEMVELLVRQDPWVMMWSRTPHTLSCFGHTTQAKSKPLIWGLLLQ